MIVRLLRSEVAADRGTDVTAALAEHLLALIAEQCAAQPPFSSLTISSG
jgi:hypothetical protein